MLENYKDEYGDDFTTPTDAEELSEVLQEWLHVLMNCELRYIYTPVVYVGTHGAVRKGKCCRSRLVLVT